MRDNTNKDQDMPSSAGGVASLPRSMLLAAFLVLLPLILYQFFFLSRDMILGDGSVERLMIAPRYPILRIPQTPATLQYDAAGRLAADLAQVYFPSRDLLHLQNAYYVETTTDPWSRPSRYAPFVHFVCGLTLCRLPYGYAAFVHLLLQLILFFIGFWVAFRELKIMEYFPLSALLVLAGLFLTPAGLSWFERGQFSLYVALSYLWLFLGIIRENRRYMILSAIFAFIKWLSFPYIFLVFCVYFLASESLADFRSKRLIHFVAFSLTIELLFLVFAKTSIVFVLGLAAQEMQADAFGISLFKLFPRLFVKTLPFLLILLGYFSLRRAGRTMTALMPYCAGAAILMLIYPTISFEYALPGMFGLIPFMIHGARLHVRGLPANTPLYLFFAFLIVASFSTAILRSDVNTIIFYVITSLIHLLISLGSTDGPLPAG